MNRCFLRLACAALALGLMLPAASAYAAPKNIKVAHANYPGTPHYRAWLDAKAFLDEQSGGKYVLDVNDSYRLGPTSTTFQGVQFGTIHITEDGSPNFSAFDPAIGIFDLPYLFPDYESADAILYGPVGRKILDHLSRKSGVQAVCFMGNTFRGVFTNEKIEHTAQSKGMKIRSTPSQAHMAGLKALGFAPTPMPWSETVTGVQQRVVAGFDLDLVSATTMGLGEIAPYCLMSQHMYSPHIAVANLDWWEGLSGEDRDLFQRMFDVLVQKSIEYSREADSKAVEELAAKGHVMTPLAPEEKTAWIKATADVYKEVPQIPADIVEEIRAELKRMGKI